VIGETIGNFKIVRLLGRGGMGEVYLAENVNIGTNAAIKVLRAEVSSNEEHVKRFFNEALAVSRIQHAGIVRIHDTGYTASGEAYLGMEYLAGETLAARIASRGPLPLDMLADFGKQIASVLGATHSAGITHRDLKPENIYIIPDQELPRGERVKILDFGIAKLTGTLAGASPQTIGTMGTPAYMAPEQWGDASKVDWRADVYSLGCVAYEMTCGRPPFICTTIAEACAKHLHDMPARVRTLVPAVPAALDDLLARLLEKAPEARPQSMQEIARAFELIGEGRGSEIRAAAVAPTQGTMQAQAVASTYGGTALAGTMPPAAAPKSRKALFAVLGVLAAGGAGAGAFVALSGNGGEHHKKRDKVAEQPPAPADAQPAPTPIDAAQVVAAPPVDAGAGSAKPPPPAHVKATIDEKAVDAALAAHQADFDNCYASALKRDATLSNVATLKFEVDDEGNGVRPSAVGLDRNGKACLELQVMKTPFPKPHGGSVNLTRQVAFTDPTQGVAIRGELRGMRPELAECAAKYGVKGKVEIVVQFGPAGRARHAALEGAHAGQPIEACMVPLLMRLRAIGGRGTAKLPIVFE